MANLPDLEAARFLVIRRDNIGDLVCTTPLIRALRQRYPRAYIAVLVNSYNRPVVENNPDIDAIYDYTKGKHRGDGESLLAVHWRRLRMMLKLRRARFDYAIIAGAHFLPRGLKLARWLKPRHIVGFTEDGGRNVEQIDVGIPYFLPRPMHEVEDVFRLLAPLDIAGTPPPMRLFPSHTALNQVKLAIDNQGLAAESLVALHISARKPSNRWPAERFIDLIQRLHAAGHGPFMLLWSPGHSSNPLHPGDDEKAGQIIAGVAGVPMLAYPTFRLDQLIAALASCKTVVCSDGGAMHVAAALGRPMVCFFGQSDSSRWYPWGVEHALLQPASKNAADVSVDEVMAAFGGLRTGQEKFV